jgi:hypothetical protein
VAIDDMLAHVERIKDAAATVRHAFSDLEGACRDLVQSLLDDLSTEAS